MHYQQLIFWFLSYSALTAGTAIAAYAFAVQKQKRFGVILLVDVSLLIMVLAASLILFSYQQSILHSSERHFPLLQFLFFLGIASSAYFFQYLPGALFPEGEGKGKGKPKAFALGIPAGFLCLVATSLFSELLFGISQLFIFIAFTASSVCALIRILKAWRSGPAGLKRLILVGGVLLNLSVFAIDIVYGVYSKIHFQRELSLFYILPVYSVLVSSALAVFILRNANGNAEKKRTLNRAKLSSCGISPREEEVVLCLIEGRSYKSIADELCISLATVQSHIKSIYRKTGVNSKVELLNFSME